MDNIYSDQNLNFQSNAELLRSKQRLQEYNVENNRLTQDTIYLQNRLHQQTVENKIKMDRLLEENCSNQQILHELDRNFQYELKQSNNLQDEVIRLRCVIEDMNNHYQKIIQDKDYLILDLRKRLEEALLQNSENLDKRVQLENQYRESIKQKLLDDGNEIEEGDSEQYGQRVKIFNPAQINEDQQQGEFQTIKKGQKGEKMTYANSVGKVREENTILKLQNALKAKTEECLRLEEKLKAQFEEGEKRLTERNNQDTKRASFNNKMQQIPYAAENKDLKRRTSEAESAYNRLYSNFQKVQSQNRENQAEISSLKKKINSLENKDKIRNQIMEDIKKHEKQEQEEEEEDDEKQYQAQQHNQQQMVIKVSEDRALLDGVIGLIHYLRESVCDVIFEVFVRSANAAHTRKVNSLIIFSINLKELKEKNMRGLLITLFLYKKFKSIIKMYNPSYGKASVEDDAHVKATLGKKSSAKSSQLAQQQETNQWIDNSIKQIKFKKMYQEREDINKDLNYLFRLLAIKYRVKYPLKGLPLNIDTDIKIKLENKIMAALLYCFVDE